tara:strand:- start:302 stop:415 length:114 start_codon:yes stop_codon:yes gene_type:complete
MFKNGSYDIIFPEDNSVAKIKRSDLEAFETKQNKKEK